MLNMLRSQQEHSSQRSRAAKIKERDKDLKDRGEVKEDRGKETNLNTKKDKQGLLCTIFRMSRSFGVSEQERKVAILGRKIEREECE